MDLKKFTAELTRFFKEIEPNSHFDINKAKVVTYPYLVFNFDWEAIETGSTGFYVDIDIFDKSKSYAELLALESKLQRHFDDKLELSDVMLVRFGKMTGTKVPTNDEKILRRYIRVYCQVDWRNING